MSEPPQSNYSNAKSQERAKDGVGTNLITRPRQSGPLTTPEYQRRELNASYTSIGFSTTTSGRKSTRRLLLRPMFDTAYDG